MEEGGNYLEDFLTSMENYPLEVRRNFELIRELDRQSVEISSELSSLEQAYLAQLRGKNQEEEDRGSEGDRAVVSLERINELRSKLKHLSAEKVAITLIILSELETYTKKLDSDLILFDTELRGLPETDPIPIVGIEPGSVVAIQPSHSLKEFILGEVLSYSPDTGAYEIADFDNTKRYTLPETQVQYNLQYSLCLYCLLIKYLPLQVIDLSNAEGQRKFAKGEHVLAVYPGTIAIHTFPSSPLFCIPSRYPFFHSAAFLFFVLWYIDTSTFYPATLVAANRRGASYDYTAGVQFQGDADELGFTPIRIIPLRHVMRPPQE